MTTLNDEGSTTDEVQIAVNITLPKRRYRIATALAAIYGYENFDEYVSDTVKDDIERIIEDSEVLHDVICHQSKVKQRVI
jgi:hypothetical protein